MVPLIQPSPKHFQDFHIRVNIVKPWRIDENNIAVASRRTDFDNINFLRAQFQAMSNGNIGTCRLTNELVTHQLTRRSEL